MTLGEGLFWSTVLILLAAASYQISIRNKWKLVGKIFGAIVLIGGVAGGGIWGWIKYRDRPHMAEELAGVRLGMAPVDVTLAKGGPTSKNVPSPHEGDQYVMRWIYESEYSSDVHLRVLFYGQTPNDMTAQIICKRGGYDRLLTINRYNGEQDVRRKLGEPTSQSISANGLSKYLSYEQWKVAYEITKGKISEICVSASGNVGYISEYGDEDELPPSIKDVFGEDPKRPTFSEALRRWRARENVPIQK